MSGKGASASEAHPCGVGIRSHGRRPTLAGWGGDSCPLWSSTLRVQSHMGRSRRFARDRHASCRLFQADGASLELWEETARVAAPRVRGTHLFYWRGRRRLTAALRVGALGDN